MARLEGESGDGRPPVKMFAWGGMPFDLGVLGMTFSLSSTGSVFFAFFAATKVNDAVVFGGATFLGSRFDNGHIRQRFLLHP